MKPSQGRVCWSLSPMKKVREGRQLGHEAYPMIANITKEYSEGIVEVGVDSVIKGGRKREIDDQLQRFKEMKNLNRENFRKSSKEPKGGSFKRENKRVAGGNL